MTRIRAEAPFYFSSTHGGRGVKKCLGDWGPVDKNAFYNVHVQLRGVYKL
jgi:hypothetical protein